MNFDLAILIYVITTSIIYTDKNKKLTTYNLTIINYIHEWAYSSMPIKDVDGSSSNTIHPLYFFM
ncbi:hypothetical protein BOM24_12410 [Tatumella sp. OPLPL6]|nr:hypothetical protein BOM24_12410 [Tatumella sp. OPLPL6]